MEDQWKISTYDPEWKVLFVDIASKLRTSLGDLAIRIDHVGSTSVVDLDAKPVIDIQISIENYDDISTYKPKIEQVGFVLREENPDKTKKYFREAPGTRRTHIHVRQAGSFSEQITLLFRDYLRVHPGDCLRYAQEKHRLMALYKNERPKYVEGKGPIVWDIIQKAYSWSQEVGWTPPITDM
ncbi:GrpB family protein [Ammoniphilus sp. CFH 90114]|uniref:GrpB family protein n=1 Tax=Ammoniphilus sp. CFH 90114 TaxID=2493665 RepID=UPI00100E1FF0|nr:GrpB family protein [Ammoniphilus sp. CFH 90114]RXT03938.1 GrpB family protein [Ammoniphilus sp. CFH 90114]